MSLRKGFTGHLAEDKDNMFRKHSKTLLYTAASIAVVCLFVHTWFVRFAYSKTYRPSREMRFSPRYLGLPFEDVWFSSSDGVSLHGWWLPAGDAKGSILFCHGNAGNIGDRIWIAALLQKMGLNVFLFDYRGYGRSLGHPSEKGLYGDALAAYDAITTKTNLPIFAYGHSLGGAVAVDLATKKKLAGLVLQSTFTSLADMGKRLYPYLPAKLLTPEHYDSLRKIASIKCPLLIAHHQKDALVPYSMGQELFKAALDPKIFVELQDGNHNCGWYSGDNFWIALTVFLLRTNTAWKQQG